MVADICEYIQGCLTYTKWATSARSVPFTLIQTGEPYELIEMEFIGPFKKSTYSNIYIYNLVDYFCSIQTLRSLPSNFSHSKHPY